MAVGADGKIWFGTQWEGDPLATPSLVGRASLEGGLELVEMPEPELNDMRRYVGAMAASRDGTLISASAPRGGLSSISAPRRAAMSAAPTIADSSGVTGFGDEEPSSPRTARDCIAREPDQRGGDGDASR